MQTTTIRKKISTLLLFTGLLTAFVACKKEKNDNPGPGNPGTAKIQEFRNGEEFIRFSYSANGKVNKITLNSDLNTGGDSKDFVITYDGDKIASVASNEEVIAPVYENNKITRADILIDGDRVGYTSYDYTNNLITRANIYIGSDDDGYEPFFGFAMQYDANGNLTENAVFNATGEPGQMVRMGHVTFTYDQKTNPLYEHRELLSLFWQLPSKNNITLENHFDENLVLEDRYQYNYTYKANGLPEKANVTIGLEGQTPTLITTDYIYR